MAITSKKRKTSLFKEKPLKSAEKYVHREVFTASRKKVSITLPEKLIGKTVEVFAFEVFAKAPTNALKEKSFSKKDFWETFGSGKNSQINKKDIQEKAWRKHAW